MSDLISRQAALAAIDKNRDALLLSGMTGAEHILVHYGRRSIEDLPTIDPVKHGKWELVDEAEPRRYGCSECKRLSYTQDNYCSYCGARME